MRYEQTKRSGPAPIDFKTNLIDAGLNYEVLKKLDILLGAKYLAGEGNELIALRDLFNNILAFYDYKIDVQETVLSGGLRYRFFRNSFASIQYNHFSNKDLYVPIGSYQWGQVWGNMTIVF